MWKAHTYRLEHMKYSSQVCVRFCMLAGLKFNFLIIHLINVCADTWKGVTYVIVKCSRILRGSGLDLDTIMRELGYTTL